MRNRRELSRIIQPSSRLFYIVLVIFAIVAAFMGQYILALAEAGAVILLGIYTWFSGKRRRETVLDYIETTAYNFDGAAKGALRDIPMPTVIFGMTDGKILWNNEAFLDITGDRAHFFDVSVNEILPDFNYKWLAEGKPEAPDRVTVNGKVYRVLGNSFKREERSGRSNYWGVLYWMDITDYIMTERKYQMSRIVAAVVMLDNYDELFKSVTESVKSTVLAAIDTKINEWAQDAKGYLSKYERDRYIFFFEEAFMPVAIADKFSLIDKVKEITGPGGVPATISIGIGRGAESFEEAYQYAMLAIDMALSRGGDQAVIKNKNNFEFYGGHSVAVERRNKVKSRVVATALGELIEDASNIIIMGHSYSDLDCIGAAAGLCCIARRKGKTAYMVVNKETTVALEMIKKLEKLPEYERFFISEQDAMLYADGKTLLAVVDTNRPEQVESDALLLSCNRVAVIDHHRRAAEYIENAALNFHEPYASSASELVTELVQYLVEPSALLKTEAEALLAGIVLDTKNFTMRTGSRTFEAAAVLRKAGSDTTEVKKLFQSDLPDTVARYSIIRNAKVYREGIAIAGATEGTDRIIAAQAADELLNISGIHTSFVLYAQGEDINISARSIGDINVQYVLEKLGGGGNRSMAGAQIKNGDIQSVMPALLEAVDSYLEEEKQRKENES